MPNQPTPSQQLIMEQMTYYPETCKTIASRLPPNITRQNVSMQCRIMADNDIIKKHSRGRFSLKREREVTFRDFIGADYAPPEPELKLKKKDREATTLEVFADRRPAHYRWLVNASNKGNTFAQSLLSQLQKGWMLTNKQMACIGKHITSKTV
jgi:hypothetical protein